MNKTSDRRIIVHYVTPGATLTDCGRYAASLSNKRISNREPEITCLQCRKAFIHRGVG